MALSSLELRKSILNYLKYMEFVKTSSPLTLKAYRTDLEQAFGKIEDNANNSASFTESEVTVLIRQALNKWAPLSLSSKNRKSATLKSFFGWVFQERLTERDLSSQIVCPKVPKKMPHFLSVDEAMAVLSSFDGKDKRVHNLREKALFLLLYGGGLRVSEACTLKWKNVHTATRSLRLLGKGQKERLVILPNLAMSVLQNLRSFDDGEFVFGGDKALDPRTAYEWVRTRGAKAHLMKPLHPHALRHSFATHLLSSGANLRTLQELLGHESLQATEKYTHLGVDQLARTLENHHPLSQSKNKL
jgi:site-specific recombinase XerD